MMRKLCVAKFVFAAGVLCLVPTARAERMQERGQDKVEGSPLVTSVAKQAGIPETQAREQIERVFGALRSELIQGHEIQVFNFGRFSTYEREVRARAAKGVPGQAQPAGAAEQPLSVRRRYARFAASDNLKLELNTPTKPAAAVPK
jgi:nucleoid DNA-binding protein